MTDRPISKPLLAALRAAMDTDGPQAVADRLGVPRPNLYRWLRGGGMTLAHADRLAAATGLQACRKTTDGPHPEVEAVRQ